MTFNQQLMQQAKAQLQGKWGNAAVGALIVYAIAAAASFTYVGTLLIEGPFAFGFCLYLLRLVFGPARPGAPGTTADFNLLFDGFKRFGDTLVAGLLITLATAVGLCLLIVPGIIVSLGFSMTYFIMIDNPRMSGIDAMQESWRMMQGHKWELFCLYFRFIVWILLGCINCGILMLWVYPYMTMAQFNFYQNLKNRS